MITVCPYSLKPLREMNPASLSNEHIIPHALGGPDALCVQADRDANSTFGATVDSDLIHDPLLRFVAATRGVRSRNGEICVEIPGEIVETGDVVTVTFDQNGIRSRKVVQSHRTDRETGVIGLTGFDSQFETALNQLTQGMARKGKSVVTSGHRTIQNPCIRLDFPSDPFAIHRGLLKIAYLTTFRALGDAFALCADGARPAPHDT